jgi:hypothetical protein
MTDLGLSLVLSIAGLIQFILGYLILRRGRRELENYQESSTYRRVRTKLILYLGWALIGASFLVVLLIFLSLN